MTRFKVGDKVVVTASDKELRNYSCGKEITTGGVFTIDTIGVGTYNIHDCCGWVKSDWVQLANQYTDEDWV